MKSQKSSFSLVFYISRTKILNNGTVPVYLKINIDGVKTSFQIKRHVLETLWDTNKSQMKGRTAEAKVFNDYLDAIRLRANNLYNQLLKVHDTVTPFQLRDAILGTNTAQPRQVISTWEENIDNLAKLIGKEVAPATVQKYRIAKTHLQNFLLKRYRVSDISFKSLNPAMMSEFNMYLKTENGVGHNTAIKFLQNFKRITHIALQNGWLLKDPFVGINMRFKEVIRPYLTDDELERIIKLKPKSDTLSRVKDFFLFSCFTGLAYIDVKNLKGKEIIKTERGYWIKTQRQKTGSISNIPILPVPLSIINRYNPIDEILDNEPVLPILSNQRVNEFLKDIAKLAGITKNLSYHVARHTFATTVTLMNDVPIESVSRMLGHKDIKTTQHYAKVVDKKIEADMALLNIKLKSKLLYA